MDNFAKHFDDVMSMTHKDGHVDKFQMRYFDIRFSNICNFKCRSCGTEFSSQWALEDRKTYNPDGPIIIHVDDQKGTVLEEVLEQVDHIDLAYFAGGEPLITDRHLKLLRQVKNKNIEIIYNTNGTFIPKKEELEEFKLYEKVTFILSVDGVKELAEKVRGGTKWSKVLEFVDWVKENKFTLEFNTVVHTNNWQGLEDLYNFCTRHDAKWYVNCLTYPHNLSINQLSFYKKRKLRNMLKEVDVPNKDFILAHLDTKPIA